MNEGEHNPLSKKELRAQRLADLHERLADPDRPKLPATISAPDPDFTVPRPKGRTALDKYIEASTLPVSEPPENLRKAAIRQIKGKEHGIKRWAAKKSKGIEVPGGSDLENGK